MRAEIGAVSRQAVYDALGILTDKGLIRRIQPARSPARYENRVDDNHHHLVCRHLRPHGRRRLRGGAAGRACEAADDHGFIIDEAEVIYWGTCPACQQRPTPMTHGETRQQQASISTHEQKTERTHEQRRHWRHRHHPARR